MSKYPEILCAAAVSLLFAAPVWAEGLGRAAMPDEISAWDIDVRPDGLGLPVGSGSVLDGEEVFIEKCAVCHGDFAEGVDRWPVLAGGHGTLKSTSPVKTIGSYWPYLSTVWDYVHRAMPFGDAQSLSDDEVYAITAYILYMNDVVTDDEFVLSNENFTDVRLPNEAAFYDDDRDQEPFFNSAAACMTDCKSSVEITMHARVLDVTPEEAATADAEEDAPEQPVVTAEADPALIDAGKGVFRQCKACHQVGDTAKNRVGPQLNQILGRAAGASEGFRYSNAIKDAGGAGLIWDRDNLSAYLQDPRAFLPGNKMAFRGLADQTDIDALIAYLQSEGE